MIEDCLENFDTVWEENHKKIDLLELDVREVVRGNKVID
jgi:hypothetical protein